MKLQNYVEGKWVEGEGQGQPLVNPVTGDVIAHATSVGVDMNAALAYAREVGNPALSALTYAQRAKMLRGVAEVLIANRDRYLDIAEANSGNSARDAGPDIDGGIGTIKYFSGMGKGLGEHSYLVEPGVERLTRDEAFGAIHILTPLKGVAIHINAFNFPSWGLWEKAAVSILAGVPAFCKPATTSSWLSYEMIKDVIDADILPAGALSLICGGGHDLMDYVQSDDAVLFTGSADTAKQLKSNPQVISSGVRFNVEADSVNMAMLGNDVEAGSPLFDAFIKEVTNEMTVKAGQKCTAIRRILVPAATLNSVCDAITARLDKLVMGAPGAEGVRMGPLMNKAQQQAAHEGIALLKTECDVAYGGSDAVLQLVEADDAQSCFVSPTLFVCNKPSQAQRVHDTEVFGPVATLMPYDSADEAIDLALRGGGSLAGSVFSNDSDFASSAVVALSAAHGRLLVVNEKVQASHSGHGIVMPQCVHGGPGRAGGGEELGGLRGLRLYHQRTAVQGDTDMLAAVIDAGSPFA